MRTKFDTVVIGGGIAGLTTAVRLGAAGHHVAVFEQGLMGGQSTTSNHGIIHSGSFYAKWHPEMVAQCQEAVRLYTSAFPNALISTRSYGYGMPDAIEDMKQHWQALGCPFADVDAGEVQHIFNDRALERFQFVSGNDASISTRLVVLALVSLAHRLGVELHPKTGVAHVRGDATRVTGVELWSGPRITARNVVVCAALGTYGLLKQLGVRVETRMHSRLDMMVAFRGHLDSVIMSHDFGGANVAPAADGYVLASPYGGEQPAVARYRRWAVPHAKMTGLIAALDANFREGMLDLESGRAHMCSKTEYISPHVDAFGGQPGFAVIDHMADDHIRNLWTVLPGKMTLGLHASHALAERMLGRALPLELPGQTGAAETEPFDPIVDLYPWQSPAEIPA